MKVCEICKNSYIFENECPLCKPMKEYVRKIVEEIRAKLGPKHTGMRLFSTLINEKLNR